MVASMISDRAALLHCWSLELSRCTECYTFRINATETTTWDSHLRLLPLSARCWVVPSTRSEARCVALRKGERDGGKAA